MAKDARNSTGKCLVQERQRTREGGRVVMVLTKRIFQWHYLQIDRHSSSTLYLSILWEVIFKNTRRIPLPNFPLVVLLYACAASGNNYQLPYLCFHGRGGIFHLVESQTQSHLATPSPRPALQEVHSFPLSLAPRRSVLTVVGQRQS